ncbi:winged helix-turn-helix transcriptional regulator [Streptomyces sp. PTD5-9]|uniref:winged helix-turn-helix transcriptional regulator n=1 Tax=Streptomyces sp. PTD5-9 TaxID=3120150 RepID=UPI003FCCB0AB
MIRRVPLRRRGGGTLGVRRRTGPLVEESEEDVCRQVLRILGVIGDKWSILVVGQLRDRTLRFGELHRAVTGISQRMLTLTLRQLERDGLLTRTVHAGVPPAWSTP